jgi:hypothetical protein
VPTVLGGRKTQHRPQATLAGGGGHAAAGTTEHAQYRAAWLKLDSACLGSLSARSSALLLSSRVSRLPARPRSRPPACAKTPAP